MCIWTRKSALIQPRTSLGWRVMCLGPDERKVSVGSAEAGKLIEVQVGVVKRGQPGPPPRAYAFQNTHTLLYLEHEHKREKAK